MTETQCVYCHPQQETVLWQDDRCRVLLVEGSNFTGWCRVVWNQHHAELSELSEDDGNHIMAVTREVERVIREQMHPVKMNLASLGTALPHLHWHLIPRYTDDSHFPEPIWVPPLQDAVRHPLPENFSETMTARLKRRFPRAPEGEHRLFVIMGVSGSGKSALSQQLSQRYGIACLDGDYLHSRENIAKMASGAALDDADRAPWLKALSDAAWAMQRTNPCSLVVCSALKKRYRDILRAGNPGLRFLFLDGRYEVIEQRLKARKGHYFRPEMLDSQFAALERPGASETDVIAIDIEQSLEDVVTHCATHLFD